MTRRLRLAPATVDLVRAEVQGNAALARALGAVVPDEWPPETVADVVPSSWSSWRASPSTWAGMGDTASWRMWSQPAWCWGRAVVPDGSRPAGLRLPEAFP